MRGGPGSPCRASRLAFGSPLALCLAFDLGWTPWVGGAAHGRAGRGLLRRLRTLFAGIQKIEIAGGEILLLPQALGHSGAYERPGRDPLEHVLVPSEHLAQLRADVRLRELRRHLPESTDASQSRLRRGRRLRGVDWFGLALWPEPRPKARRQPTRVDARGDEPRRTGFDLQGQLSCGTANALPRKRQPPLLAPMSAGRAR